MFIQLLVRLPRKAGERCAPPGATTYQEAEQMLASSMAVSKRRVGTDYCVNYWAGHGRTGLLSTVLT